MIIKIAAIIPQSAQKGHIASISYHGTLTFIPNIPAITPSGRNIVATAAKIFAALFNRFVKSFKP